MARLKELYYGIAAVVKGVCDRTYYQDRPTSVDSRIDSYLVISLPSAIENMELDQSGAYGLYRTTLLLEVYVRDRASASNPVEPNIALMDEKVSQVMSLFPVDTDKLYACRPEAVMRASDGSGFHMTLVRAALTTKITNNP